MRLGTTRTVWLTFAIAINAILATVSLGQDNSYISPTDGFWDEARLWSLVEPPSLSQSGIFITNAANVIVTIDSLTANSFPDTLTISNLTISPPQTNNSTLYLNNTGSIALHIIDSLNLNSFGDSAPSTLISSNSTLVVDGASGGGLNDNGTIIISGGSLIVTNCSLVLGFDSPGGTLTITNGGLVEARDVTDGDNAAGPIQIAGGTMRLSSSLVLGGGGSGPGDLAITDGGLLVVTNGPIWVTFGSAYSTITVSNAFMLADDVNVGYSFEAGGNIFIEDGTVTLSGSLNLGGYRSAGGASLSGGILTIANGDTVVGNEHGDGGLTINNGLFLARSILVGAQDSSEGVLTINGGSTQLSLNLEVGGDLLGFAHVFVNAGQLVVTNGTITVGNALCCDPSVIQVDGGLLAANYINVGPGWPGESGGTISVESGSVTVSTGITLGDCVLGESGFLNVEGGQTFVTNATGAGFIDVQNGELAISGGTLQLDRLVMTNICGEFSHTGGTLIVGNVVLDPNFFRITSVTREGNDLRVTWMMGPGQVNALQASDGGTDTVTIVKGKKHHKLKTEETYGNYSTNGFTDIFIVTNNSTPGTLTNFLDVGGATNLPSRYYRARLSP